jgi:hypothetical protein
LVLRRKAAAPSNTSPRARRRGGCS